LSWVRIASFSCSSRQRPRMNEARETWPLVTAASSGVSPSALTAPRRDAAAETAGCSSAPGRPCRTSRGHGCRRCGGRCSPEELFPAAPPGSAGPCASFPRSCRTRLRPGDVGGLPVILMVVESWELLMMNSSWLLHRRVWLWQLLSN
jgi:hypothetical protein